MWIGGITAAFLALTVLVGLSLIAALSMADSPSEGGSSSDLDDVSAVRGFFLFASFGWTGRIAVSYEEYGLSGGGAATLPVNLFALAALGALTAASWWLTRRFPPQSKSQLHLQVALATVFSLMLLVLISVLGRISSDGVSVSTLGAWPLLRLAALLSISLLVGAALAAPTGHRVSGVLGDRLAQRVQPLSASLDVARAHVLAWSVLGILVGAVTAISNRDEMPLGISFSYLTSAVPMVTVLSHLGSSRASAAGDQDLTNWLPSRLDGSIGINLLTEGMPWFAWLLPVLAVLVIAALATRLTLMRAPGQNVDVRQIGITAGVLALFWIAIALLLGVFRASGSFGDDEQVSALASFAPSWWAFVLLALTGVAVELVHGLLGARLVQYLPRGIVQRLAPRPHPGWMPYLGGPGGPSEVPDPAVASGEDVITRVRPTGHSATTAFASAEVPQQPSPAAPAPDASPWSAQQETSSSTPGWGERQPTSRRTKIVLGSLVSALVLAGVAWFVIGKITERYFGPKGVALDYATAVVDGRAEEALSIGRANIANKDRLLLTDEIYSQTERRPSRAEVTDVTESDDGETATVLVEFEQDGERFTEALVARKSGRTAVLFPEWELEPVTLPTASLTVMSPQLEVNKNKVDLAEVGSPDNPQVEPMGTDTGEIAGYRINLPVLPGTYSFDIPSTEFAEAEPVELTISSNDESGEKQYGDGRTLTATATPKFLDEVTSQVKAKIDACAKDYRASAPCPFDPDYLLDESSNVGGVEITVDEYPSLDTEMLGSPIEGASFPLQLSGNPTVTETGTYTEDDFLVDKGDTAKSQTYVSTSGWSVHVKDGKVEVAWTDPQDQY